MGSFAQSLDLWSAHPFYFGFDLGYGSTDWAFLAGHISPNDGGSGVYKSAPIRNTDKGFNWGLHVGYEINTYFVFEVNYTRYRKSIITLVYGILESFTSFKTRNF